MKNRCSSASLIVFSLIEAEKILSTFLSLRMSKIFQEPPQHTFPSDISGYCLQLTKVYSLRWDQFGRKHMASWADVGYLLSGLMTLMRPR